MPEFPLQSACTALLKYLSTFILAVLNNFPSTNFIKLSIYTLQYSNMQLVFPIAFKIMLF